MHLLLLLEGYIIFLFEGWQGGANGPCKCKTSSSHHNLINNCSSMYSSLFILKSKKHNLICIDLKILFIAVINKKATALQDRLDTFCLKVNAFTRERLKLISLKQYKKLVWNKFKLALEKIHYYTQNLKIVYNQCSVYHNCRHKCCCGNLNMEVFFHYY